MPRSKKDEQLVAQIEEAFKKFQSEMKEIETRAMELFKSKTATKNKKKVQEALDKIRKITASS